MILLKCVLNRCEKLMILGQDSPLMVIELPITQFTTRTPAVTDVFGSGRNSVALRPVRRVGFR